VASALQRDVVRFLLNFEPFQFCGGADSGQKSLATLVIKQRADERECGKGRFCLC
jgi:hypothetical protein